MAPPLSPHAEPAERLVGSDRVLALLIELANRPDGASLDELARAVASPKSTVHRALADRFGETAHYAILDGADVVYRAKVDPPAGAVRLTSTVGGRNPARATAVGKVLLAHLLTDDADVAAWARLHPLAPRTPRTLTDDNAFVAEVARARVLGYAVDNQENEPGVNCIAIRLGGPYGEGAVSVSGLSNRTPLRLLEEALDEIRAIVSASY